MKMTKSISLLESHSGNQQFTSKAPAPGRLETAKAESSTVSGALGVRSMNSVLDSSKSKEMAKEMATFFDTKVEKPQGETAFSGAVTDIDGEGQGMGGTSGSAISDVVSRNSLIDVLTGIVARHDPKKLSITRANLFRDMYYHDATCGSAVDLLSTIPFSDFSLTGIKDEKMTKVFVESIESMNMQDLLPNITLDYNVLGGSVLSTRWDDGEKMYKGVVPHRLDYCTFTQVPVYGVDPFITVTLPNNLAEGLNNPKIIEKYKDFIPEDLLRATTNNNKEGSASTGIELDPENTIFIPRRGLLKDYSGMSLLNRALPAWLYEKALIRGTLDQVYKKQRATTHIMIEQTEDWVPSQEEMNQIAQLFLNADLDPLGAIVVTRSGVSTNEIRRGDDFWRWDQNYDVIEKIKLRAIGISENFVSTDANYSTMEQTLSVFMENVRDFRSRMTREIFYEKVFPRISAAHGYTMKRYGGKSREVARFGKTGIYYNEKNELVVTIGGDMPMHREFAASNAGINPSDYLIPQVAWHKRLMPEADSEYLAVLQTLEQVGVPVSIRHWIAAGGLKVEALINGFEEDLETRTKILEYKKELQDLEKEYGIQPQQDQGGGGEDGQGGDGTDDGGGDGEFANYLISRRLGVGGVRRRSILSRGNPDLPANEIAEVDGRGRMHVLSKRGREVRLNRYTKIIASAAAELGRQENARNKDEYSRRDWNKRIYT